MALSSATNQASKSASNRHVETKSPVKQAKTITESAKTKASKSKSTPTLATDRKTTADHNQFRQTGKQNSATAPKNTATAQQKQQASSAELRGFSTPQTKTSGASTAKLSEAVSKGGLLKNGSKGPAVAELQQNLSKLGFKCEADGDFGPKTQAALKKFQASQGISQDGVFGAQSLAKMQGALSGKTETPKSSPSDNTRSTTPTKETPKNGPTGNVDATGKVAPSSMNEAQKYDHYKKIIEAQGGTVSGKPNERQLLGLRQETNTKANGKQGVYDDKMVMLWKDASGKPHVKEYKANTEPSARYEDRMGQDANGDGRLDQGRLAVGNYKYAFSTYNGGPALRMVGDSKVERDTNHDGLFNDGKMTGGGASMLFHVGGNNMTGSAGCQTMPPAEFNRFWSDLTANGKSSQVNYTVVNM